MAKNTGKTVCSNYSRKSLVHVKQAATNELKTVSKLAIKKRAKATGDLIGK